MVFMKGMLGIDIIWLTFLVGCLCVAQEGNPETTGPGPGPGPAPGDDPASFRTVRVSVNTKPGKKIMDFKNSSGTKFRFEDTDKEQTSYFRIDQNNGDIYLAKSLTSINDSTITLKVSAVNGRGKRVITVEIIIISVNETDLILYKPDGITNGTDVNFTCEAHGFINEPDFRWKLSDRDIPVNDRFQVTTSQRGTVWVSELEIIPILYKDRGLITCSLTATVDQVSSRMSRSVSVYIITRPVVEATPKSVFVQSGQEVSLNCSVVEPPGLMATMSWYKLVNNTEQLVSQTVGSVGRFTFTIRGLTEDTDFVCEGHNNAGTGRSNLVIVRIIDLILHSPEEIMNGTDVNFTCEAHGFINEPVFQWKLSDGDIPLGQNDRFQVTTSQRGTLLVSELEIRPILYKDHGLLTCGLIATDDQNSVSFRMNRSVNVYVKTEPTVVARPKSLFIQSGQEVSLNCSVVEPPEMMAVMSWYKVENDTEQLLSQTNGSVVRFTFTTQGLTEDTDFVCEGYNNAGIGRSNLVTVRIIDLILHSPEEIMNGTDVNFTCEAHGFINEPVFQWKLSDGDIPLGQNDRFQVNTSQRGRLWVSELEIRPILYKDHGLLTCGLIATDDQDSVSFRMNRSVHVHVKTEPTVVARPKSLFIQSGQEVSLNCSVVEPPEMMAVMSWYKVENDTEQLLSQTNGSVVRFTFTTQGLTEDTDFVCEGYNNAGIGRSNLVTVRIIDLILHSPEEIMNGTDVNFTCEAHGFINEPVFQWKLSDGDIPLGQNDRFQVTTSQRGTLLVSELEIRPILYKDHGLLTCGLIATDDQSLVSFRMNRSVHVYVKTEPTVVARPKSLFIQTGQEVSLNCSVVEPPEMMAVMSWYKVENDTEQLLSQTNGSVVRFTFTTQGLTEDTDFVCEGYNNAGIGRSNLVTVRIIDLILHSPEGITNGTDVNFTCEAHGLTNKPVFQWKLSDRDIPLAQNDRFQVSTSQRGTLWVSELEIRSILYKDRGLITCSMRTTVDQVSSNISRSVSVYIITRPVVEATPKSVFVQSGQEVSLNCSVVEPPGMMVMMSWYKVENDTEQLLSQTNGSVVTFTFTIRGLTEDTEYVCDGYNNAGVRRSNVVAVRIFRNMDNKTCPQTTDEKGVVWKEALPATLVVGDCPSGFTGKSSRRCNKDGGWEDVDYDTNCSQNSLNTPLEKANQITEGSYKGALGDVLVDLQDAVNHEFVTSSDIDIMLKVLESVSVGFNNSKDQAMRKDDVLRLLDVVNTMLGANESTWINLMESDRRGPKSLMFCMEEMARLAIKGNSETDPAFNTTYASDTIFFQIGSVDEENIECPQVKGDYPAWMGEVLTSSKLMEDSFPVMEDGKRVWFSGVIYRDLGSLFENQYLQEIDKENTPSQIVTDMVKSSHGVQKTSMKDVVSRVMAFSVYPRMARLSPPLYVTMQVSRMNSQPVCSYLNFNGSSNITRAGNWSSEGCTEVSRDGDVIVCACSHTTNFAILMSPVATPEDEHDYILSVISIVGCGVSLLFLLTTIFIYCMVWRYMVKTQVARIKAILLMNLCVTLIISYTLFLAGVRLTQNKDVCTAIAALLHYFFLTVFCVMLAEGIHLFISIVIVVNFNSYLKSLLILIWVTPALIVGITIGVVKVDGYTGQRFCWLSTESNVIWAFVGPALLIIVINTCILLVSLRQMLKRKSWDDQILKQGKYLARALAVILPIIGITWVVGVFAINRELIVFQYLFAICNTLQGVFIFIFHCCTSNVRAAFMEMRNRFRRQSMSKSTLRNGSTSRTKSTSHESYPSVKSVHSNYTLSLTTKALRQNSDFMEKTGPQLGRFIALPRLFDPDLEVPTQMLIKDDSLSERGSVSPTSVQHINLGFTDTSTKRVSFSVGYSPDDVFEDGSESYADPESYRRRRSITFLPLEDVPETEVERQLRKRKKALDQMYDVCNAFTELRKSKEAEVHNARNRWRMAFDAIHTAKSFKVSSPTSSVRRDVDMSSPYNEDSYYMQRM